MPTLLMMSAIIIFTLWIGYILYICDGSHPVNVALGKKAYQTDMHFGGTADKAVDGGVSPVYWDGSCTHTATGTNAFWEVDLAQTYAIDHVTLYNRMEFSQNLKNVRLLIGKTNTNYTLLGYHEGSLDMINTFQLKPPVDGKWVRITRDSSVWEPLTLCEVEVFAIPTGTERNGTHLVNAALGKKTYQTDMDIGGTADKAVDGGVSTVYSDGSCTHTATGTNAFWEVDLGQTYTIDHVTLYNRKEIHTNLRDVQLLIGKTNANYTLHGYHEGILALISTFKLKPPVVGKWVRITRNSSVWEPLTLCEVQVFTIPAQRNFRINREQKGTGAIIKTLKTRSLTACGYMCLTTYECEACNVMEEEKECQLLASKWNEPGVKGTTMLT